MIVIFKYISVIYRLDVVEKPTRPHWIKLFALTIRIIMIFIRTPHESIEFCLPEGKLMGTIEYAMSLLICTCDPVPLSATESNLV